MRGGLGFSTQWSIPQEFVRTCRQPLDNDAIVYQFDRLKLDRVLELEELITPAIVINESSSKGLVPRMADSNLTTAGSTQSSIPSQTSSGKDVEVLMEREKEVIVVANSRVQPGSSIRNRLRAKGGSQSTEESSGKKPRQHRPGPFLSPSNQPRMGEESASSVEELHHPFF
ncbi:hypothetical protein PVK06_012324 [Gossypium arboreum]|uniref:Uncharacterized protein n=1 Tax=Gossypium arboreum TaxID=29729 RepID=A0ABR0QB68_GOSAR|nr:hypothetical protein PVK06_012324 [Gossypium arboreum]